MKKCLLLLLIIWSYTLSAQKDYGYIDHTTRSNGYNDMHFTDSLIYYSPIITDSPQSAFNTLDSTGILSSYFVFNGSSRSKIIAYDDHKLKVYYYNLLAVDVYEPGFFELDISPDTIISTYHDIELDYNSSYFDIELTDDNGYVILTKDLLLFYTQDDQLLSQITITNLGSSSLHRNKNGLFLKTHTDIYRIENQNTSTILTSMDHITKVFSNYQEDLLHVVSADTISILNTISLEKTDLYFDSNMYTQIEYNQDSSYILYNDYSEGTISQLKVDGEIIDLYTGSEGEHIVYSRLIENQLYLNGFHLPFNYAANALFKKVSIDSTSVTADCLDPELFYAEIEHIEKTFHFESPTPMGMDTVWKYVYRYDVAVKNNSFKTLERTDVYSLTFDVGGFFSNSFLHFEVNDIPPLDIKTVSGEFVYYTNRGIIRPRMLYIKGADYLLDCDESNNIFDVSQITSSTIGLKPKNNISVFPNPTNEVLYVKGLEKQCSYEIMDLSGKTIKVGIAIDRIDVSTLVPSTYFIKIDRNILKFIKI